MEEEKHSTSKQIAIGCLGLVLLFFAFFLFVSVFFGEGPMPPGRLTGIAIVIIMLCLLAYYLFAGDSFDLKISREFLYALFGGASLVWSVLLMIWKDAFCGQ